MKFTCLCGRMISDSTDGISYKARIVADQDWEKFIGSCEGPQGCDGRFTTSIYQCPDCGSLRIEKPVGQVVFFRPESNSTPRTFFQSVEKDGYGIR